MPKIFNVVLRADKRYELQPANVPEGFESVPLVDLSVSFDVRFGQIEADVWTGHIDVMGADETQSDSARLFRFAWPGRAVFLRDRTARNLFRRQLRFRDTFPVDRADGPTQSLNFETTVPSAALDEDPDQEIEATVETTFDIAGHEFTVPEDVTILIRHPDEVFARVVLAPAGDGPGSAVEVDSNIVRNVF